MGLGTNPPPQFGHTLPRMFSTQAAQNVHSNVQMRASGESGGNATLQCSQVGLSSSMAHPPPINSLVILEAVTRSVARASINRMLPPGPFSPWKDGGCRAAPEDIPLLDRAFPRRREGALRW